MKNRLRLRKVCLVVLAVLLVFVMGTQQVEAAGIKKTEIKSVKVIGAGQVKLTWKKASGVSGYEIYQSTQKNKGFKKVATVKKSDTTSTKIKNMDGGKKYYYKIRTYKKSGKKTKRSGYSKVKSVKIVGLATVSPNTKPYLASYQKKSAYNKNTKQYFMLQSYLEYMEQCGGGTLTLKKGTYNIPGTLFIPSGVNLVLADGTVINKTNDAGSAKNLVSNRLFVFVEKAKKDRTNAVAGYKGAKDISITCKGTAQINTQTNSSVLLNLAHNNNVQISGIQFGLNGKTSKAISLLGCSNVTISDCTFTSAKKDGTAVVVDIPASEAKQNFKWSKADNTVCKNIKISDATFSKLDSGVETTRFMKGKYHSQVKVLSSNFKNIKEDAIRMMNWTNPTVQSCRFESIGGGAVVGSNTLAVGIRMYGCQNPVIQKNHFNNAERAIYVGFRENADKALKGQGNTSNTISESTLQGMLTSNTIGKMGDYFISYNDSNQKEIKYYWFPDKTKNYTMTANQSPYRNQYLTYKNYNATSRQYYVMKSYLEQIKRNGGGSLTLEAGTYKFFMGVNIPSNVKIILKDGVKINCNAGYALFTLADSDDLDAGVKYSKYNGVQNVSIEGPSGGSAQINANYSENATIIMLHSKNVTVKNLTFKNMNASKNHFIEVNGSSNVLIEGNQFLNSEYKNGFSNKEAINIDLPDINTGGIEARFTSYDCTPDSDITIQNNVFKNLPVAVGSHNYTPGKMHKRITIANNQITNMDYMAIRAMNWDAPVISGNTIDGIGDKMQGQAIWLQGVNAPKVKNNVVSNAEWFVQGNIAEYNDSNVDKSNSNYKKLYNYAAVKNTFSQADITTIGLPTNTLKPTVINKARNWNEVNGNYDIWTW